MNPWMLAVGAALGALLLYFLFFLLTRAQALPYVRREALFSPAECAFLRVLDAATEGRYRVFGKVRLADVLGVKNLADAGAWRKAFNRISAKHFDYVLCDIDDLRPVCAIELDDRSHDAPQRRARDVFVDEACAAAGLPLLRVPVRRHYDVAALCAAIEGVVDGTPIPNSGGPTDGEAQGLSASPDCPVCGAPMRLRTAQRGARQGVQFWGCADYPACRGTRGHAG